MKALRFTGVHKPFEFQEVPEPKAGPGEVVIQVEAAGLCASDLHVQEGKAGLLGPMTVGHEIAGKVLEIGAGVDKLPVGTRVAVSVGNPMPGLGVDGGMAELVLTKAASLVPVPGNVAATIAAVATDSVATAYHAVKTIGGVRIGEKVGVLGPGGLGLNGVQIAALSGAKVIAASRSSRREEKARAMGASDFLTDFELFQKQKFDCVLDFVCSNETINTAIKSVKYGGRVILVGLDADTFNVPLWHVSLREISIHAAFGSNRKETLEVLDLISRGLLTPQVEEIPFEEAIAGYERLKAGSVEGRLCVKMS